MSDGTPVQDVGRRTIQRIGVEDSYREHRRALGAFHRSSLLHHPFWVSCRDGSAQTAWTQ
jgi:hypothetical protein